MKQYLESSEYINWNHPKIIEKASCLSEGRGSPEDIARACFGFVRDDIKHSWDYQLNPVTCKASDVLAFATGFCYAKSHLLAALLRANGIPTALCYQRLTIANDTPPFCLHGLNAIYLEPYGWFRVDARGNSKTVSVEFNPTLEDLAFPIVSAGEFDFPARYSKPRSEVIECLSEYKTYLEVGGNLPDVPEIE